MPDLKEKKSRVLIIAEEPDIVKLKKKILILGECEPIIATSPRDGFKILEERYKEISMVLLDILIPNRSGYYLLEEIKTIEKYKDIRVVRFTDKRFRKALQKGKTQDVDDFISVFAKVPKNIPYCKYCGGILRKEDSLCHVCGNKVD